MKSQRYKNNIKKVKHDINVGNPIELEPTTTSPKVPKKGGQDKFKFLKVGVYKAGIDTLSQIYASTRSMSPPERGFFYDVALEEFADSIHYICAAFDTNPELQDISIVECYSISYKSAITFSHALRILYDSNFLTDNQYCAIRTKLNHYVNQLTAILKSLKSKVKEGTVSGLGKSSHS